MGRIERRQTHLRAACFIRPHTDKRVERDPPKRMSISWQPAGLAMRWSTYNLGLLCVLALALLDFRPLAGPGVKKLLPRAGLSPTPHGHDVQIPPGGHTEVDTTTESTRWPRRDSSQRPLSTDQQKQILSVASFSSPGAPAWGMHGCRRRQLWMAPILSVMC